MDTKNPGSDKGANVAGAKQKLDHSENKTRAQASTKKNNISWTARHWKSIAVLLVALAGAAGYMAGKYNVLSSQQQELDKLLGDNFSQLKNSISDYFGQDKDVKEKLNDNMDQLKNFLWDKLHEYNILLSPTVTAPVASEETSVPAEEKPKVADTNKGSAEKKDSSVPEESPSAAKVQSEKEAIVSPESKKTSQAAFDASKAGTTFLTAEQLAEYDGSDESKPILIAVKGKVYDVSKGKKSYGKNGNYNMFAGKDATRMFATGKLDGVGGGSLEEFSAEQQKGLDQWEAFYAAHPDYTHVANLA